MADYQKHFKPIQDGGKQKKPPLSPQTIFPVTSANVGLSPQNFLTFRFNPFCHTCVNFKAIPSARPKLLNFSLEQPLKIMGFSGQILIKLRL